MKVCIFGTCRVCNLFTAEYVSKIIPYVNAGDQSRIYKYKNATIHAQPITYTTKLSDTRDVLKYMYGNVENNIDPNSITNPNINLIFF